MTTNTNTTPRQDGKYIPILSNYQGSNYLELTEDQMKEVYETYKEKAKAINASKDAWIQEQGPTNAYFEFIEDLVDKTYPAGTLLAKHHIVPRYAGGDNSNDNLIQISWEDHALAHCLLYQVYIRHNDVLAFRRTISVPKENRGQNQATGQPGSNLLSKREAVLRSSFPIIGKGNPQQVSGRKGGLANTPLQQKMRSKLGKQYGRSTGIRNQRQDLTDLLTHYTIYYFRGCQREDGTYYSVPSWPYKGHEPITCESDSKFDEFYTVVSPHEAFRDIMDLFIALTPGIVGTGSVDSLYKVPPGPNGNKRIFGWRFVGKLTRSEVETGDCPRDLVELLRSSTKWPSEKLGNTSIKIYTEDDIIALD